MYLAYDLLGGEHGPLRSLTRGVTYAVVFGVGYSVLLGPVFGVSAGLAHGITLAWEFSWMARRKAPPGAASDAAASALRGIGFGLGGAYLYGSFFGVWLGVVSTVGQIIAYRAGVRPTADYRPARRLGLTKMQTIAAVNRTVGYSLACWAGAAFAGLGQPAETGVKVGLVIGVVTALSNICTPLIEWIADNSPARTMGVFGVALILIGFALQSGQYWMTFLDIPVT